MVSNIRSSHPGAISADEGGNNVTYDAITDQFSTSLSPLAKRMYAALFEIVTNDAGGTMVNEWQLDTSGMQARNELLQCGLTEPVRGGTITRYRLTSAAWRAHVRMHNAAVIAYEETVEENERYREALEWIAKNVNDYAVHQYVTEVMSSRGQS
jgi:hypothetical protein